MYFGILVLLFIAVPFVELMLLLMINDQIGLGWTLGLVVVTAVTGSALAKSQGYKTYAKIREELAAGRMPQASLVDAIMIFVAGALLFTPGVLTDVFGLSLLLPPCRAFYRYWLARWFKHHFKISTNFQMQPGAAGRDSKVVDSYVVDADDSGPATKRQSSIDN